MKVYDEVEGYNFAVCTNYLIGKQELENMDTIDFQYGFFLVDERAFCLWDQDLRKLNLDFLNSVDPEYYEYLADVNYENLGSENEKISQHAAVAIRAAFSQGLETLFAFIFASIQAPHCVPAWMALYKPSELHKLVRKVSECEKILSLLKTQAVNWQALSNVVYESLILEDKDKENSIKNCFGQLWSQLSSIYLQDGFSTEYNSIKHGLRVKSGGFYLAIGAEDKLGVPPARENMTIMGKSKFGTSYYETKQIGEMKRHIQIRGNSRNWDPEDMVWGLKLISTSISNIISALKIFNGIKAEDVQFHWPSDLEVFKEPSKRTQSLGVTSMSEIKASIPPHVVTDFSKEEIIQGYLDGKFIKIKRIRFDRDEDV